MNRQSEQLLTSLPAKKGTTVLIGGARLARYRGVRQALALTSEVFDELPSAPGPPDSGEGTVSGPGRRTVCRKTTSSEQHAREFARASGRLAKTAAIDAAKDCSGPRYRNEIVALQLRMLGNSVNGTAPKTEASEKVPFYRWLHHLSEVREHVPCRFAQRSFPSEYCQSCLSIDRLLTRAESIDR
jgi:hypothetical protein